jgi:hypothetical protein
MQNTVIAPDARALFNAAFKVGTALGRKFEAADMSPALRQAARAYAASYAGDFAYMVEMRDTVAVGGGFLSDGQSKGVLNCLMADARRRLADRKPAAAAKAPEAPARVYLSVVPDGRYRVTQADGSHIALRLNEAGKDSKLNGSRIVSVRAGEDWMGVAHITAEGALKTWRSLAGDLKPRVLAAIETLDSAEQADGWLIAGLAFAQEGSQCFFCGRDLDTPESLAMGYGPVCADKHGLPWGDKATPMSVRLAQAEAAQAAPAPAAEEPVAEAEEPAAVPEWMTVERTDGEQALLNGTHDWQPAEVIAPAYTPREFKEDPASIAERDRYNAATARAKLEGRARTYTEIFGEDL